MKGSVYVDAYDEKYKAALKAGYESVEARKLAQVAGRKAVERGGK